MELDQWAAEQAAGAIQPAPAPPEPGKLGSIVSSLSQYSQGVLQYVIPGLLVKGGTTIRKTALSSGNGLSFAEPPLYTPLSFALPLTTTPPDHYIPQGKLSVNAAALRRAWESSQRVTKDDWAEWMRNFSVELLRQSPSQAWQATWRPLPPPA